MKAYTAEPSTPMHRLPPGFRRIGDIKKGCTHREHNPPGHIVLPDGVYEYTCPGCGQTKQFRVQGPIW